MKHRKQRKKLWRIYQKWHAHTRRRIHGHYHLNSSLGHRRTGRSQNPTHRFSNFDFWSYIFRLLRKDFSDTNEWLRFFSNFGRTFDHCRANSHTQLLASFLLPIPCHEWLHRKEKYKEMAHPVINSWTNASFPYPATCHSAHFRSSSTVKTPLKLLLLSTRGKIYIPMSKLLQTPKYTP